MLCRRCIIPDTYPGVDFKDGLCTFCREPSEFARNLNRVEGEGALKGLLASRSAEPYQCLVPLSGGKDSSYILYYVVRRLGLKPLALFVDSGFSTASCLRNVERLCQELSVELVCRRARFRSKIVRHALSISRLRHQLFAVCQQCENNIRTAVLKEALRRGIPFVIYGSTSFEEDAAVFLGKRPPFRQSYGQSAGLIKQWRQWFYALEAILKRERISMTAKYKIMWHYLWHGYYCVRDNIAAAGLLGVKCLSPSVQIPLSHRDVQVVSFFDYIAYRPMEQIDILKRETSWEAPVNKEVRLDCRLQPIIGYDYLKRTGISKTGFFYAVLVRQGQLTREEALRKEQAEQEQLRAEREQVFQELGQPADSAEPQCFRGGEQVRGSQS